jgi:hypothetical protein
MTENMLLSMKGFPLDRWLVAFDDEQYQRCLDFFTRIDKQGVHLSDKVYDLQWRGADLEKLCIG